MFRVLFAPIIRSSKNCMWNHWYKSQNVVVKFRDEVVVSRWYLALLWPIGHSSATTNDYLITELTYHIL
jgi:hypothetical protein